MGELSSIVAGENLTITEASKKYGISITTLYGRKALGRTLEEAVFFKNKADENKIKNHGEGVRIRDSVLTGGVKIIKGRKVYQSICDCGAKSFRSNESLKGMAGCRDKKCYLNYHNNLTEIPRRRKNGNNTKEYSAWACAKHRCFNPKNPHYKDYGGRGITMSEEFSSNYETFFSYIGEAPSKKHSLDRINNDGNYERGNLRWTTQKTQCSNRRKPSRHLLEIVKLKGIIANLEDTLKKEDFSLAFLEGF